MSPSPITPRRQVRGGPSRCGAPAGIATAVLGVALALAACDDATGPLPMEGAPDDLEFSIGAFGVGESTVELRGDTLVLRRTRTGAVTDSVRAVPTPDSWRGFWSATERAGVRRWRARYAAEAIDGVGWSVRIAAGGRLVESSGSNAYPDRFGREHDFSMTDDFRAFLTAVGELVEYPVWF